ncbi:hypothetical protein [Paenarthrobacter nicotinovorans]|uniref:hypothetical protein n=1 Tax=Paenarthrobacter nicotinovorans TaxID=29320 RepID=UPI0024851D08|nr:hypothetical protein [Paenarthrobacter nicotinovorans]MDI2019994.1 hypothetical protein [Paenarthrobacter nicotinovorans]
MRDNIRRAGRFINRAVEEGRQRALQSISDEEELKGFTNAAEISLRQIQEHLDALKLRMDKPGLTKAEQLIFRQLDQLKSELEAAFEFYWKHTEVDWRPPQVIAKALK